MRFIGFVFAILALVFQVGPALGTTPNVCRDSLARLASVNEGTVVLVAPISGGAGMPKAAREMFPASVRIVLLFPPGSELPTDLPANTSAFFVPDHLPSVTPAESLRRGIEGLLPKIGRVTGPVRVYTGAEYGVDWGMALRKALGDPSYAGPLQPWEFVSKSAVRRLLEKNPIADLIWPKQFDESTFEGELKTFVAKSPDARMVVKFDNSSGMNGLRIVRAGQVLDVIAELRAEGNKWGRAAKIIVEEYIDDIPLPKGAVRWQEIAVDGIAYQLPTEKDVRVKFFSLWAYEKDENKMYLTDTLVDPMRVEFSGARRAIVSIVNGLGYREGGLHFEVYVAVDANGKALESSPVILGDPNFRFGGNNKFGKILLKQKALTIAPERMLFLGSLSPEALHALEPRVKEGSAKVVSLSFQTAPTGAKFTSDPSELVEKVRALGTYGHDSMTWSSANFGTVEVGRASEMKQLVDVLLVGDPEAIRRDEQLLRQLEKDLAGLMKR